jgi:hypothetical protein
MLFVMFLEHRVRAFQGTFYANPGYAAPVRPERMFSGRAPLPRRDGET